MKDRESKPSRSQGTPAYDFNVTVGLSSERPVRRMVEHLATQHGIGLSVGPEKSLGEGTGRIDYIATGSAEELLSFRSDLRSRFGRS
jgi:hypothetical protein